MAYSEEILRRARRRLEQAKAERERENEEHLNVAYQRLPRLREIDRELRLNMVQLASIALRSEDSPSLTVAQIRDKNLELQREREWIIDAEEFEEGYLDDSPVCSKCGGSGYYGAEMCSCLKELCRQEQKKELTSLIGSGRETFDNFRLDVYPDQYDHTIGTTPRTLMTQNLRMAKAFAAGFTPGAENLLFSGMTGLGKTFLSACIARQVADRGFSVVYETAIRIFEDFERVKFGSGSEEDRSTLQKYFLCDLLIIDDLGSEMTTQFTISALYRIINTRLMENRSTIISTNLDTNAFEQWYHAQISSRVLGNYRVMIFKGQDLRRKQGGFR
ncbi:MAG: ATP-binding protein [Oscillospiraceae bacterium]|nr:ATP-binding protein [Oscillospiraceae bacterium]